MTTYYGNQDVPGGANITWNPLLATDFVSTTVYKDPNALLQAGLDITIDPANGNITFPLRTNTVDRDGIGEGATWRLNICTAARGLWRGDGTQAIIVRMTPIDNPGKTYKPMVGLALCDRGGDATNAAALVNGTGIGWYNATNVGYVVGWTRAGATIGNIGAFAGNTPDMLAILTPCGPIGDDTNVGAVDATVGTHVGITRLSSNNYYYPDTGYEWATSADGVYLLLAACFDAADPTPENVTFTVKIEWAIVDIFPENEWAP